MTTPPLARLADALDRRLGREARNGRLGREAREGRLGRGTAAGVWSIRPGALLGHVAVVAFGVLLVTGVLLGLAYRPSVATTTYHGASPLYDGQQLPGAFASVVRISEDLPGGLLLRRLHVAAAHLLLLALVAHLLRTMATGAFRRPRLGTHLTGVGLLLVTLGAAYTGELLPMSLVSGSSLRIAESVLFSLPLAGEQLGTLLLDGELPSQRFLTIAWAGHLLVLPLALVLLLAWHVSLARRHGQALAPRRDLDVQLTTAGRALWPDTVLRLALLAAVLVAVLLVSSAIVPWSDLELEGPFLTAEATNSVHPHWALFFLTGGLRILPAIDVVVGDVRITNVLVAGVVIPGVLVGALVAYPLVERRVLGDRGEHHRLEHPLTVPLRAGVVTALTTVSLVLACAGAVDVLSFWLDVPVEAVVRTFQVLVLALPALATTLAVVLARRRARRAPAPFHATPPVPDRPEEAS